MFDSCFVGVMPSLCRVFRLWFCVFNVCLLWFGLCLLVLVDYCFVWFDCLGSLFDSVWFAICCAVTLVA